MRRVNRPAVISVSAAPTFALAELQPRSRDQVQFAWV